MDYLPIFMNIKVRSCLVGGGGEEIEILAADGIPFQVVPGTTQTAIVQQGTTPNQRVVTGTLATLPAIVQKEAPKPPTLIIVGGVVALRQKLSWFKP